MQDYIIIITFDTSPLVH